MNGRTAADVTDAAIEFVDGAGDGPFFLFLNYYDPHTPYTLQRDHIREFWKGAVPPARDSREWRLALYDAEIRYTDHHFGRLLQHLKRRGLYEDAWILVTADHGELMGDNDMFGHGNSLSQPEIRIPLVVKDPGPDRRRGVDSTVVQQVDLMPTILDRLDLEVPADLQGGSFGSGGDPAHPIVAEVYPLPCMNEDKPWRQLGDWRAVVEGRYKFVWGGRGRHLLFDLEADPEESVNLLEAHPDVARRMREAMEAYFAALPEPGEVQEVLLDPEILEQLRAVGYLGGDEDGGGP